MAGFDPGRYTPVVFVWKHFFEGTAIGISVAAPVGPMALLCISRTLVNGRWTGFISGLAAATVDLVYASLGAFGLGAISGFLVKQQLALRLLGAVYLLYLAVATFRQVPDKLDTTKKEHQDLITMFIGTVVLNLTNPLTIMPFIAMFATAGLSLGGDKIGAASIVFGVFVGASSWWLVLSTLCNTFRRQFKLERLQAINRLSAIAIGGFAVCSLYGVATSK